MILSSALDTLRHLTSAGDTAHIMSAASTSPFRSPLGPCSLEEAEEIASMYLNDYHTKSGSSTTAGVNKLEDYQASRKDLCFELLPTPPRSPDRSDSSSSGSDGEGSTTTSVRGSGLGGVVHNDGGIDFKDGAFSDAWTCFEMDELDDAEALSSEVSPSPEEQEAICNILFEHDDFIEQLLNDDSVLNSVLGGGGDPAPAEDAVKDDVQTFITEPQAINFGTPSAAADWYPSSLPPVLQYQLPKYDQSQQLLHDCMWSGQCTVDCKQKAAREKMSSSSSLLSCSPFEDLTMSPASAMTPRSPDDVLDMRIPLTPPASGATVTMTAATLAATSTSKTPSVGTSSGRAAAAAVSSDDALVAGQCVDPSSVLSYTPLSDHSYHQATSSAPPTPPDSPKAVSQQSSSTSSATSRGSGNGSAGVGQLTLYRSHNGNWQRGGMVMSDTPSESDDDDDDDDDDEEEEQRQPSVEQHEEDDDDDDDDDDEDDDDDDDEDDDDDDDEEIDVVTVAGERHQRHGGAPAVVALPANGATAIRCAGVRGQPRSTPATPVVSRITSSGRVVTPSHKALHNNGQTSRRRRRGGVAVAPGSPNVAAPSSMNGKRKRSRQYHHHHHHHQVSQHHHGSLLSHSKRARRDHNADDAGMGSPSSSSRRGHHPLSQLPPSVRRNEHNTMERKRRDDLRVAFQDLRVRVPSLFDNKKAAKVTILNEAASYAHKLTNEAYQHEKVFKHEQQRHQMLRRKLAQLQQQCQQQRIRHGRR